MPSKRSSKKSPSHIGSILTGSFSSLDLKKRLREYRIKKDWVKTVGESMSKKAHPTRLRGKTLHVTVSSSPWMSELRFLKHDIISKINESLGERGGGGEGTVTEIVFKTGPIEEPPPPPQRKKERPITREEKLFIERIVSRIKDKKLKTLFKKVIAKGKSLEDGD